MEKSTENRSLSLKAQKIPELESIRAVSIIGVLIIHSSFTGRFSTETILLQEFLARFFDWSVLGFFFVSGVLRKPGGGLLSTFKSRFVTLIIPFFLYEIIYRIIFIAMDPVDFVSLGGDGNNLDLISNWLIATPAFQLYFLPYLFLLCLLAGAFDILLRRFRQIFYLIILIFSLVFYAIYGYPETSHGPEWQKMPAYIVAFLTGDIGKRILILPAMRPLWSGSLLGLVFVLLMMLQKPVISMFIPLGLLMTFMSFPFTGRHKVLVALGSISGSIYLWHTPVLLPMLTKLLAGVGLPSLLNFFLSITLTIFICIYAKIGLSLFFDKYLHRRIPRWISL